MTQILLYQSPGGIVIATDSRAVAFHDGEEASPQPLEVQKLFHLAPQVLAATAGAGYGILLCQRFQQHSRHAGLYTFDEIARSARAFLRSELEAVRQRELFTPDRADLDRVYFLIAGKTDSSDTSRPFPFLMLASEGRSDPLHEIHTTNVVAIPRQISVEHRLARFSPSSPLHEVESLFENFLLKLAQVDEDVGPPFHFARIDAHGIRVRTLRP